MAHDVANVTTNIHTEVIGFPSGLDPASLLRGTPSKGWTELMDK